MSSRFLRKLKISLLRAWKLRFGAFLVKKVNKRKQLYNLHYPNDLQDVRRKLLPGDVLLVEGDYGVSDWIKVYSSHTWSHCALFVGDPSRAASANREFVEPYPCLVEAIMGRGVILGSLSKYEGCNLRICRPRNLTRPQREAVIRWALGKIGVPYDLENVLQFMSLPFEEQDVPPTHDIGEASSGKFTCSSLLAAAFGQVGLDILHYYDRTAKKVVSYHYSQIQPKDFDLSPSFDIVKVYPAAYRQPGGLRALFSRQKTA